MTSTHDELVRAMAFIFLACAHGSDGELGERERNTIVERLASCLEVESADQLEQGVREAVDRYQRQAGEERLREVERSLDVLAESLTNEEAERYVTDLIRVVDADGRVIPTERDFVRGVAERLGVSLSVDSSD